LDGKLWTFECCVDEKCTVDKRKEEGEKEM
jgi:hypothetical protein